MDGQASQDAKCVYFRRAHPRGPRFDPPLFESIDMGNATEREKSDLADMLLRRHKRVYARLARI